MIYYLDTSVLVTALTLEPESQAAVRWLEAQPPRTVAVSAWVTAEFSTATAAKQRARLLTDVSRRIAQSEYRRMIAETFLLLSVHDRHMLSAALFGDRIIAGLRAGDALHLAIADEAGLEIVTRDIRLHEAGTALGVRSTLI